MLSEMVGVKTESQEKMKWRRKWNWKIEM